MAPKTRINAEFHAQLQRGYTPATEIEGMPIGVIPVDAIFSPVRKVNFHVEKVRVGQATDFDRMVLELWTDGTVAPVEAVSQAAVILIDQFALFSMVGGNGAPLPAPCRSRHQPSPLAGALSHADRGAPALRSRLQLPPPQWTHDHRPGCLSAPREELLALRNFGHKSYDELRDRLIEMNYIDGAAAGLQIVADFRPRQPAAPRSSNRHPRRGRR